MIIKRILATYEDIALVLLATRNAPLPFTADETNMLKDIENLLSVFQQVSEKVSGGTYVTISLIIPLTNGLYRKVQNFSPQLQTSVGEVLKNS